MSTGQALSGGTMSSIKLKKKHIRFKHQKVKLFRANEPIISVFMWGINHTVSVSSVDYHIFPKNLIILLLTD